MVFPALFPHIPVVVSLYWLVCWQQKVAQQRRSDKINLCEILENVEHCGGEPELADKGTSHKKSFLNENKHMQGWNPKKPTKLDGNDTTAFSHHPLVFCMFECQQVCICCVVTVVQL